MANLGGGQTFNETSNATSYYHHSIGGYHAAKLHRYQALIERRLSGELNHLVEAISKAAGNMAQVNGDSIAPTVNMLNTKYLIFSQGSQSQAIIQPYTNGNKIIVINLRILYN